MFVRQVPMVRQGRQVGNIKYHHHQITRALLNQVSNHLIPQSDAIYSHRVAY